MWFLPLAFISAIYDAPSAPRVESDVINEILASQEAIAKIVPKLERQLKDIRAKAEGQDKIIDELLASFEATKETLARYEILLSKHETLLMKLRQQRELDDSYSVEQLNRARRTRIELEETLRRLER